MTVQANSAIPSGRSSGRRAPVAVAVLVLIVSSVFASGAGAAHDRALTVYSVATGVQYINTADDRARGQGNNPLDKAANRLWPKSSGGGKGPFAGDIALYALKLYSSPTLKRPAGSAVYTCFFNYDRHALCQAYYRLTSGSVIVASGPIDFKTSGFTIVVTGGTKTYLGVRGQLKAASAPRNAQKIDFELIR